MTDHINSSPSKVKQLEDLLDKNEKRAERMKILNDQIKSQLEMEKEKNDEIHQVMNQLKQQLFKSNKDYKDMKELYEEEKKKVENLTKELNKMKEKNCCSCAQQPSLAKHIPKNPSLTQNLILAVSPNQMNGNMFYFKGPDGQPQSKQDDDQSVSSQSSQVSDEDNMQFERTRKRTMTISVRFNNDKGADRIRAISKSIVARNYESDFQEGLNQSGSQSPYNNQKSQYLQQIDEQFKQAVSNNDLDQIECNNYELEENKQQDNELSSSQDLPQITFNKKSSSNKPSQFKQQSTVIKFNRRMSKTHSTIRSTIENFEDHENGSAGSQNQSIKSIIIQKKSQNSFIEQPALDLNHNKPSVIAEEEINKDNNSNNNTPFTFINLQNNHQQETLNHISEEGLSLSTSNVNSGQNQSNRLFEKFFVLGCDREDMVEFDSDQNVSEALLPGKITYSYPELNNDDPQDQVLKVIHEFAFPKGIKCKKIKISTSFRKVTQFILSNSKTMVSNKFYMFTMKSSAYYDTNNNTKDQNSVLNSINPHRLMYCFCFKSRDYLETTTEEQNFQSENNKFRTFWESKKVYCFVTYFPFYELFQDMLINVINQVKISRTSAYSELESSDPRILQKLDGDCVKQIIKENMEQVFQSYQNNLITDYSQIIMIDTLAGPVKYVVGNQYIIQIQTHKWSLALSLSNLSLQNLMFIFHAILLENTVIFNSKNKCLLTQTIHTFEQLINPFSWPYPIIYLLPDSLQTLFDSPVPIIMGVNKSTKQLCSEDVYDKYKDHIFFDLDYHRIYCNNKQTIKRITSDQSYLNNIYNKLEKVYSQINPQGLVQKKPSLFSDPFRKECEKHKEEYTLKYFSTKQDDQISEIILNLFNESLRQCFIDILPKKIENMILQEDSQIDYPAFAKTVIDKSYGKDRAFVIKFINTQIFTYFIENYYQFE